MYIMKSTLKVLIILSLFVTTSNIFSQNILAMGIDTVASIETSGVIKDISGNQKGEITISGEIKNHEGQIVGYIVGDKFKTVNGVVIGERKVVGSEVQILLPDNNQFGKIESGNKIVDMNDEIILLSTESVSENHLIAYFFFF